MAADICWNKISRNCVYILSEIDETIGKNYFELAKIRKKINDKKTPKPLSEIVADVTKIYDNLYDINLFIYKSLRNKTIIEIRYVLKTSHTEEFYPTIKDNEPMLHCKISKPFYVTASPNLNKGERKFDVNWQLGGIRHEWNTFIGKTKYRIWKMQYDQKKKMQNKNVG